MRRFNKSLEKGSVPTRPDTRDSASGPGVCPELGTNLISSPFLARKGERGPVLSPIEGMVDIVVKHSLRLSLRGQCRKSKLVPQTPDSPGKEGN